MSAPPTHPEKWPPPLAAPSSLLGQLQRGLGSGARAALAAGVEAAPTVLEAFAIDPRCDRQIDARADYYARLVLALGIDIEDVRRLVTSHAERTPNEELGREPLAIDVLGRLVQLGNRSAARELRAEALGGPYWLAAIEALVCDDHLQPRTGWHNDAEGIGAAVNARGDRWLVDLGHTSLDATDEPWRTWIPRFPMISKAFDEADAAYRAINPVAAPDVANVPTAELLGRSSKADLRAVTAELTTRTAPDDRAAMLAAARQPQCPMRAAAIRALARQHCAELLPTLLTLDQDTEPQAVVAAMISAFRELPAELTQDAAITWLASSDDHRQRRAAAIAVSAHGPGARTDVVSAALARELDRRADADEYVITSLAQAHAHAPEGGPYDVLTRAFNEMEYSYGRRFVAAAIAATDPAFADGLAIDALWDAEPSIRALGAAHASLGQPAAADRLAALAADPHEDEKVRAAAAARAHA